MKRFLRALAYFWVILTAAVWLWATVMTFCEPGNLGIGLVEASGRAALWVTVPAAVVALAGCVLMWRRNVWGAWLLVAYGLFWGVALVGGAAKDTYDYLLGHDVYLPGEFFQLLVVEAVLGALFLFVALWAWRNRKPAP